ncbi:hypothetical protein TNCV_2511911 [Trichonephila clavipes]|nr:hypothetical protein TNCV_2511911 [Trichonephila clavipes]
MIMKFEETGDFGVLPGRGLKPVGTETVEEVATAVVERTSSETSSLQQALSTTAVVTSSTVSVPIGSRPLPGNRPKSLVSSN